MFREVNEIKEVNEVTKMKEIMTETEAIIFINAAYDAVISDKIKGREKDWFVASVNKLIENINSGIKYKQQINPVIAKIKPFGKMKKIVYLKDFIEFYKKCHNILVTCYDTKEWCDFITEWENSELKIKEDK